MLLYTDILKDTDDFEKILKTRTKLVSLPIEKEDAKTLDTMKEYIVNSIDPELEEKYGLRPGVGLSAPQIGISKSLAVVHFFDEDSTLQSFELINPRIVSHSIEQIHIPNGEGCLSVDREVKGIVPRFKTIKIKNHTRDGDVYYIEAQNFLSIVMQHEIDHLKGI